MRIRTGHTPDAWTLNEPASAHLSIHHHAVQAVSISDMKPVLTHGQTMTEARREQAREATRRYRARAG